MRKVVAIISFIVIFILIFIVVTKILWLPKNPITEFYKEPKNSLDIVYLGASNVYAHFNTTLAYKEYGYTTGLLSNDSEPLIALKYLIKESEKYQKPKLFIIDIARITEYFSMLEEGEIRKTTDSMKNSKNRIDCINALLQYTDTPKLEYYNYYFSFFKYHDIWKDKDALKKNIKGNNELYKGYLFSEFTSKTIKNEPNKKNSEMKVLHNEIIVVMKDLFKFINDNKLNVLFVIPKRVFGDEEIPLLNYSINFIKENGFEIIDFNNLNDFEVDFDHDFYNFAHLNVYGATKYTLYFSRYLHEHYDLKDHRGDSKYKSWDMEYKRFKDDYKKVTGNNFDDLLQEYKNQGF